MALSVATMKEGDVPEERVQDHPKDLAEGRDEQQLPVVPRPRGPERPWYLDEGELDDLHRASQFPRGYVPVRTR